ncbi:hemolymph lipopolysaccharide-binding protein isoform X2 [Megalopta genalis]|uniref:hemolymph lipopolysaccharide-binding protein isoform X2 n=1 Tax=Megalopta genalis TaxID=115081 RepID=UPI003FD2FA4D
MQKLAPSFLAFAIVALFVAEFPYGEATDEVLADVSGLSNSESNETEAEVSENLFLKTSDDVVRNGVAPLKLYKRLRTWNDARKTCQNDGGQLVVIDSAQKVAIVRSWLASESLEAIWVGFHDLFEEGSWTTVTGESVNALDYYPWANDQPDNQFGIQHCAVIWRLWLLDGVDDYRCDSKFAFVCENKSC